MLLFEQKVLVLEFLERQRLECRMELILEELLNGVSPGGYWILVPAFFNVSGLIVFGLKMT